MTNQVQLEIKFKEIAEVSDRLGQLNRLELAEMRNHLSNRYQNLMSTIISKAPQPLDPKGDGYRNIYLSTLDKDNFNAPFLKHFIKKIDKILMIEHLNNFDATIFLNQSSQKFFNYIFEHWLRKETTLNHLHFVFRKLWLNNDSRDYNRPDNLIITANFRVFAENWNKVYLRLCPTNKLELKRFNLRTFAEIGYPVCDALDLKINAIILEYAEQIKDTHKLP